MQTITVGAPLVLLTWLAVAALVWRAWGPVAALVALALLPALALCDVAMRDRAQRARARMRAWFAFRGEPALQKELVLRLSTARNEAAAIEEELRTAASRGQALGTA
jgi:hypothetical protein